MISPLSYILQFIIGFVMISYLSFSIFSVIWALRMGDAGIHSKATLLAKMLFWHGVGIITFLILSASGSVVLLFGKLVLISLP